MYNPTTSSMIQFFDAVKSMDQHIVIKNIYKRMFYEPYASEWVVQEKLPQERKTRTLARTENFIYALKVFLYDDTD